MADLAAVNKEQFDKHASSHLSDWAEFIQTVIEEVGARRTWMSSKWTDATGFDREHQEVRLLDYACGSGTVSKALLPFVTQAVGLDISSGMVAEFNKWARGTEHGPERLQAYEFDMLAEAEPAPNSLPDNALSNFDIIVVSMALHHVSDPGKLMVKLGKCLRKGGRVVILDRIPDSTISKSEEELPTAQVEMIKTINQHGFSEEDMRKLYQGAGISHGFDYVLIERPFEATVYGRRLSISGFACRGGLE